MLGLMFEKHAGILYNSDTGMLNLAAFREGPDLQGVLSFIDFNKANFCEALATVIKDKIGAVRFINFQNNNVKNVGTIFRSLNDAGLAYHIMGLSFANNVVEDLGFVGQLPHFTNLQEISFSNNPVQKKHNYRNAITRKAPTLVMLDAEGITRPPMQLPNPTPASGFDEQTLSVLQYLERAYFSSLCSNNGEALMSVIHPDVHFSMCVTGKIRVPYGGLLPEGALNNVPPQQRDAVTNAHRQMGNDMKHLEQTLKTRSNNFLHKDQSKGIVKGRTQVMLNFEKGLYNARFLTNHEISGNANVRFVTASKVPIAQVAVHGLISWSPVISAQLASVGFPPLSFSAYFDRSITLVLPESNSWLVTNDSITLREVYTSPYTDEPLYFATNKHHVQRLCAQAPFTSFGYPPEIVMEFANNASSDAEIVDIVCNVNPASVGEALAMCNNNNVNAARVGLLAAKKGCSVEDAFKTLSAVNFDMSKA